SGRLQPPPKGAPRGAPRRAHGPAGRRARAEDAQAGERLGRPRQHPVGQAPARRAAYLAGNSSISLTFTLPGACAVPTDPAGALLIQSVTKRTDVVDLSAICVCRLLAVFGPLRATHAELLIELGSEEVLAP